MKEKNKPEPEIVEQSIIVEEKKQETIVEKTKRERKYIALSDVEIIDLIETYRKLLRSPGESNEEKDSIREKIENMEREMMRRNKIKTKQ